MSLNHNKYIRYDGRNRSVEGEKGKNIYVGMRQGGKDCSWKTDKMESVGHKNKRNG